MCQVTGYKGPDTKPQRNKSKIHKQKLNLPAFQYHSGCLCNILVQISLPEVSCWRDLTVSGCGQEKELPVFLKSTWCEQMSFHTVRCRCLPCFYETSSRSSPQPVFALNKAVSAIEHVLTSNICWLSINCFRKQDKSSDFTRKLLYEVMQKTSNIWIILSRTSIKYLDSAQYLNPFMIIVDYYCYKSIFPVLHSLL